MGDAAYCSCRCHHWAPPCSTCSPELTWAFPVCISYGLCSVHVRTGDGHAPPAQYPSPSRPPGLLPTPHCPPSPFCTHPQRLSEPHPTDPRAPSPFWGCWGASLPCSPQDCPASRAGGSTGRRAHSTTHVIDFPRKPSPAAASGPHQALLLPAAAAGLRHGGCVGLEGRKEGSFCLVSEPYSFLIIRAAQALYYRINDMKHQHVLIKLNKCSTPGLSSGDGVAQSWRGTARQRSVPAAASPAWLSPQRGASPQPSPTAP